MTRARWKRVFRSHLCQFARAGARGMWLIARVVAIFVVGFVEGFVCGVRDEIRDYQRRKASKNASSGAPVKRVAR